ncbi:MAG: hypothetical protein H0U75_10275 [Legionella sp.]|nr:hypothetical protein [Legionella sp.]
MKLKLNTRYFTLPNLTEPNEELSKECLRRHETKLRAYLSQIRFDIDKVKAELYDLLDVSYTNALIFDIEETNNKIFFVKPSLFLERAYLKQTYNSEGDPITNRDQSYIKAGVRFNRSVDNKTTTTTDGVFLNACGDVINVMNSLLSQINKVEAYIIKKDFESVALLLPSIDQWFQGLLDVAHKKNVIEIVRLGKFQTFLSELCEHFKQFIDYLKNINKSEKEINADRFFALQTQVITALEAKESTPPPVFSIFN